MSFFKNLKLENFRNFNIYDLDLSNGCNILYGKNGALDSLALVQLIVALEQRCESDFGVRPNLTTLLDKREGEMPFSSVQNLCRHLISMYK